MNENHARTAVEWHLNALTEFPHHPWQTAQKQLKNPRPAPAPQVKEEPLGPAEYDTGLSAEEGLWARSEEHTSELQSRGQLVCRLLLEKNKQDTKKPRHPDLHNHT